MIQKTNNSNSDICKNAEDNFFTIKRIVSIETLSDDKYLLYKLFDLYSIFYLKLLRIKVRPKN